LEDFCSSLLGHLQTLLYFPIVLDFRTFFVCGYYYSVYPGPSETVRGSNFWYSYFCLLLCFTLCPFVTKRGSYFYFWIGIVFLTGQVIFVPEWPKGKFVSL